MSVYRVEKTELPVVIFQADGSVMKGVVFLSASAYNHMGQQTLLDLMKEPGNFFPFRSAAGSFCIANKTTITHIRFDPPAEVSAYESLGDREDVDIKFVGPENYDPAEHVKFLDTIMKTDPDGIAFHISNVDASKLVEARRRKRWSSPNGA